MHKILYQGNVGHINPPSIQALIHGLNRHYYSIVINWRKTDHEQKMLLNLHKPKYISLFVFVFICVVQRFAGQNHEDRRRIYTRALAPNEVALQAMSNSNIIPCLPPPVVVSSQSAPQRHEFNAL